MNYLEVANKVDVDLDARTFKELPCKQCPRKTPACEFRACLPFKMWFRETWRTICARFNVPGKEFPCPKNGETSDDAG